MCFTVCKFNFKFSKYKKGKGLASWCLMLPCPLFFSFSKIFLKNLFYFYLFLGALGLCCYAWVFSSCSERGLLFIAVRGPLIAVASLVAEHGLQACGLQQLWHVGYRAQAQQLWLTGLVAPQHVGSSRTRARTHVPCIGRRIHCATREGPCSLFKHKTQRQRRPFQPREGLWNSLCLSN